MFKILQRTSLKTIELDYSGEYRCINVDSILVTRIRNLLNSIYHGGVRSGIYGYARKNENHELNVVSFFRGFRPDFNHGNYEEVISRYFHNYFEVGEKGKAYRENVLDDGIPTYFYDTTDSEEIDELLQLINSILKKNNFGKIKPEKIRSLIEKDTLGTYMYLLNLAHNIGGRWENKCRSPFVSASYGSKGFETALRFAQARNTDINSYVIWGFTNINDSGNYIFTKELSRNLGMMNVNWYEDIHSEIIIKDSIAPQNILGVFEINNETSAKQFIINPSLYKLFYASKDMHRYKFSELVNYICREGIPIDQSNFMKCARELGYKSYGYRLPNGQTFAGEIDREANIRLPENTNIWD